MTKPMVYLAGPMTGVEYHKALAWRMYLTARFEDKITTLSPMRGTECLKSLDFFDIKGDYSQYDPILGSPKAAFERDLLDIRRCDILIANFIGATEMSAGTVAEVAYAYGREKPVITVISPEDTIHNRLFIREMSAIMVDNLEDTVTAVMSYLGV